MNHLLARFFHLTKPHLPDGLQQPQREAIVDLLNLCRIADHKLLPSEEFVEAVELGGFSWESEIPLILFSAKSLQLTDTLHDSAVDRAAFLQKVAERLGTSEVRTHAIAVCQALFLVDGEFVQQERVLFREIKRAFGWPEDTEPGGN